LLFSRIFYARLPPESSLALLFRNQSGRRLGYQVANAYALLFLGFATMVLADNLAILRCPACGGMMKLVRSVPRPEGLPPLIVMSCMSCNEVEVKEERRVA
jgi:hypothetical protein